MEKGFEGLDIGNEDPGLFGQEDGLELASGDEETAEGSFLVEDQIEIGPSLPLACVCVCFFSIFVHHQHKTHTHARTGADGALGSRNGPDHASISMQLIAFLQAK